MSAPAGQIGPPKGGHYVQYLVSGQYVVSGFSRTVIGGVSRFSRTAMGVLLVLVTMPSVAGAQELARFSLDSAVSIDKFVGQSTTDRPNVVIDVTAVTRLADRWVVYLRPWIRHDPRNEVWNNEIYQAALQYERPGPLALRIDAGYIVSPIGLGLMDSRPGINPTITTHPAYVQSMPAFDPGSVPVTAIAGTYPPGGQLTLSTTRWDARVAVVGAAPNRKYVIHNDANPRMTPVVVVGGGMTPTTGLRLGVAFAGGEYVTGEELAVARDDGRGLRMLAFEGEYAFGYTKLSAEVVRDRLEKAVGSDVAYTWFVQGMQTVTPRWFVAARQEGVSAPTPPTGPLAGSRPHMHVTEGTVGYRLTPELTVKGSFVSRKAYTRAVWDQQVGVSLVWAQRWR